MPDHVRPHLIAVLIEALSDAGRHAQAGSFNITVGVQGAGPDQAVVLEVCDDGIGFMPRDGVSGLANMRDRARDLGGVREVRSGPGEGTTVCWTVPIHTTEVTWRRSITDCRCVE